MNNENNKESIFDDAPAVTIVSGEQVPTLEETISVDINGYVDPISMDYNEYRNKLVEVYSTSTEDNSVISSFNVQGDKCEHILTIRFADGTAPITRKKEFEYTDNFKNNFILPMVEDYNSHNTVFDSSTEVIEKNNCNFIARTSKNDSLCISNIDIDFANKLRDLLPKQEIEVSKSKTLMKLDKKGIGNYLVIILTVIAIGMTLAGTIFFTIASR